MTPSSKAAKLEVFYQPPDVKQRKKLQDGQELPCVAGMMLTGLSMFIAKITAVEVLMCQESNEN